MCTGTVGGKEGIIVEIILGRPLFSKFLTVSKTRKKRQYEHFHFCMPGEPAHCNVDLLEPDGEQVHREIEEKRRKFRKKRIIHAGSQRSTSTWSLKSI